VTLFLLKIQVSEKRREEKRREEKRREEKRREEKRREGKGREEKRREERIYSSIAQAEGNSHRESEDVLRTNSL